ncbi:MAG: glycoside hydrolase family 9 protein [Ruminococcus sp.]|nr:glycoside hydrolase family 9 protein [Ruminococcus sp.]
MSKKLNKIKSAVLGGMMAAVSVAGSFSAVVPSMSASAAGSDDYAKLLQYSLYFYDANMCGEVGTKSAMSWRGNCHTSDEVTGGFHDAGDHAMFGLPQGYAASTLGWSYYEFKDAYDATGQGEHLKAITDYFCDFFKKSTKLSGDSVSNFLYQKEDGNVDHSYWGAPENQTGSRKMYWTSNGASDIAADYAAALALNYLNFGNAEDLKYAEALYKFSTQNNQVATDGPYGFYNSSSCVDEQANAAGWLYLATKNESYKNDCASKQAQYLGWVDGWENRELGAACVYAHITNDWSKVNDWIGGKANGNGYFFLDKWGSARINCSMQFTALVASKNSSADYTNWCKGQMNFITGDNPANTCFVVGFAPNSAKNPHHRGASGFNSYDEFNGEAHPQSISPNGHSLIGALVGGPTDASGGGYSDDMNDYVANEVALDYNAGLVGAAAGLYSVYKTGSTVSSIEGVDKIYSGSVNPVQTTTQQPIQTTTSSSQQGQNTTVTTTQGGGSSSSGGAFEAKLNQKVDYTALPKDDKMIGWKWADLGVTSGKPTKVEINISANGNIGKWQGAFGSSTSVQPDYWTQTEEMQQTFNGNTATITWDISKADSDIIQTKYNGELKFGIWWIDCQQFTIDSIKVYTDGAGGSSVVNTTTPVNTTQTPSNTTTSGGSSSNGATEAKLNQKVDYTALPKDDKMIGWKWADLGVTSGKPTKVEINISANGNIGKWQGAFGSSTSVQPGYWTQTDDMQQTFNGNTATITWDISKADSEIIQTKYNGELKFGIWWIDCQQFTIDSIKVYTDGAGSSAINTTTTTRTTTTTTTTTTVTTQGGNSGAVTLLGDANGDGQVNIADATAIVQYLGNRDKYPLDSMANADCCNQGDGVTGLDALAIQKIEAGMYKVSDLPVRE